MNDLHVFDLDAMLWKQPAISGILPSSRSNLGMTAVGSKLFVFGGINDKDGDYFLKSNIIKFDI